MKLFVAGLPSDFDETDLKEMFELYGELRSAKLITDRETGKSKGFGFIDMIDKNEAMETIEALDGAAIKGKKLSVKEAEERQPGSAPEVLTALTIATALIITIASTIITMITGLTGDSFFPNHSLYGY
jgi:RNA recognition motif-containing protein